MKYKGKWEVKEKINKAEKKVYDQERRKTRDWNFNHKQEWLPTSKGFRQ